jgi:hypothetical protein
MQRREFIGAIADAATLGASAAFKLKKREQSAGCYQNFCGSHGGRSPRQSKDPLL